MIELSNIEKRFGDAVILKDISIRIPEGSVTALVGPSGGGKSTLLRCINLPSGAWSISCGRVDLP